MCGIAGIFMRTGQGIEDPGLIRRMTDPLRTGVRTRRDSTCRDLSPWVTVVSPSSTSAPGNSRCSTKTGRWPSSSTGRCTTSRNCARTSNPGDTGSGPAPTRRRSCTPTRSGGRRARRDFAGCSPTPSGTGARKQAVPREGPDREEAALLPGNPTVLPVRLGVQVDPAGIPRWLQEDRPPGALGLPHRSSTCPRPKCIFQGMRKLPPAHSLTVSRDRSSIREYWDIHFRERRAGRSGAGRRALGHEFGTPSGAASRAKCPWARS